MDDLKRLRFVTERYPHLQGLRLLPLAVPFLISALWRNGQLAGFPGTAGRGAAYWFLGLTLAALVVSTLMGTYYSRRFGSVEPTTRVHSLLAGVGYLSVLAAAIWAQDQFQTTLSIPIVLIALGLCYVGATGGQLRTHYLALGALALLFAALGPFGASFHAREVLLDALIGFGFILIGVGDHRLLRGTLQPVAHV